MIENDIVLLTILTAGKVDDITNSDIDDSQEPLILLLELLLVKYLDRENAIFVGAPAFCSVFALPI